VVSVIIFCKLMPGGTCANFEGPWNKDMRHLPPAACAEKEAKKIANNKRAFTVASGPKEKQVVLLKLVAEAHALHKRRQKMQGKVKIRPGCTKKARADSAQASL